VADETTRIEQPHGPGPEPQRIDRYIVDDELGRGTMGVVYAAHDSVLGRTVALKTIELAFAVGPSELADFEQRFFTEARIAAKLSHPGIVVCHDVGKDSKTGKFFIVFEHLKGQTLASRLARGPFEWREALTIIAKVARAIDHAHEHGVVHRDLKPANVMLLQSGEPKIMDFGVARMETSRVKLTATGTSFGSPLYMSPEQALGAPSDARSDVFSLASILCTLLLGRPYFDAENIPKILARVIREEPPLLSRTVPGVPVALDLVITRALAKRVDDRYPTALDMAEDLDDILAGRPPRHASAWVPTHREGTMPSPVDHDALIAELTASHAGQAGLDGAHTDPLHDMASLVDGAHAEQGTLPNRTGATAVPPRRTRTIVWAALAVIVVAAGLIFTRRAVERPAAEVTDTAAGAGPPAPAEAPPPEVETPGRNVPAVVVEPGPGRGPTAPASTPGAMPTVPGVAPGPVPTAAPPPVSAAETAPPVEAVPEATAEATRPRTRPDHAKARLRLRVEHSLEKGSLGVWIDGALVFETPLESRITKKVVAVKLREGRLDETLQLEPGKHHIRVEVAWEDNRRSEQTTGVFEADRTRELAVTLGRIKKNLSLDWK
jgi:eukaryotic-like serine/threonine-protein kinase